MAGEEQEDVELRDLVAQTLETQGILGKIRAQLRASVFLALEEQESKDKPHPLGNDKLKTFLKSKEGQMTAGLVQEFLEFFELDFTCSVFDPETNVLESYQGRDQLANDAGLNPMSDAPLLLGLLKQAKSSPPQISENITIPSFTVPSLTMATSASTIIPAFLTTPPPTTAVASIGQPSSFSFSAVTTSKPLPLDTVTTSKPHPLDTPMISLDTNPLVKTIEGSRDDFSLDGKFLKSSDSLGRGGDILESILQGSSSRDGPFPSTTNEKSKDKKKDLIETDPLRRGTNGLNVGGEGAESDDDLSALHSAKYDTTDHSLSQTSTSAVGDFDYTEHIQ